MKLRALPLDTGEKRKHEPRLDQAFSEPPRPAAHANPPGPDDVSKTQICSQGPTMRPPHAQMTHTPLCSVQINNYTQGQVKNTVHRGGGSTMKGCFLQTVEKYQHWKKKMFHLSYHLIGNLFNQY